MEYGLERVSVEYGLERVNVEYGLERVSVEKRRSLKWENKEVKSLNIKQLWLLRKKIY